VTTHNQFLQSRFGGIYLPNGKDVSLFNPNNYNSEACRSKLGLAQYRVLMFPGAPRPYKGVEDILSALDILGEADIRLVIVGGSPYDDYDQLLHQKWGKWIIQLPKAKYEDMPMHIAASHIVVVPQRDEPATKAQFPLKLTDGMAMAKPILATRVGDIPTILSDSGFLVEPSSPHQLAEKIKYIFANYSEAEAKGKLACDRCREKYSIQEMSRILEEVFKDYKSDRTSIKTTP
jgi:glycosyltransferase involved in cell wall biosynthesis